MVSRSYCWTLNNFTEADVATLTSDSFKEKVVYSIFGKEVGESGTPHLQGYTVFRTAQRYAGAKKLLSGRAHLEPRKGTHKQASDYCKKSDDFVEYGDDPATSHPKKYNPYSEAMQAGSYEAASLIIQSGAPRDWLMNGDRIRENLKRQFIPEFSPYVPIHEVTDFVVPQELTFWEGTWQQSRTRVLILVGASCLGKTAWARSLRQPHTYWKGMTNLDDWNPESKLLIFDDFDWKYMPQPKSFLTQAGECTVTDKYRHKKNIIVNMPAIYICNNVPAWTPEESTYWGTNSYIVHISNKLY